MPGRECEPMRHHEAGCVLSHTVYVGGTVLQLEHGVQYECEYECDCGMLHVYRQARCWYCDACSSNHQSDEICPAQRRVAETQALNAYNWRAAQLTFYGLDGTRDTDAHSWDNPYFGIEIECESPGDIAPGVALVTDALGELVAAKRDGSLTNGAEFVTMPMTLAYAQSRNWQAFAQLRDDGWRAWDTLTAGYHVHVSRVAFHIPYSVPRAPRAPALEALVRQWREDCERGLRYSLANQNGYCADDSRYFREALAAGYWVTFGRPEPELIESAQSDAHLFKFCQLILRNRVFWQRFSGRATHWANFRNQERSSVKYHLRPGACSFNRYVPVNLCNRSTVEIRLFRGTINPDRILANLESVAAAVAYTRNLSVGEVAGGGLGYRSFSRWVMNRESLYPHFVEILDHQATKLRLTRGQPLGEQSSVDAINMTSEVSLTCAF